MSIVQRVTPVLEQAIAAILNRAEYDDTVSIKAAVKEIRRAAPYLAASDEELTEAISKYLLPWACLNEWHWVSWRSGFVKAGL